MSHNADTEGRYVVGWLCPSMPDGPMIPVGRLCDPCGKDVPVWSDSTMGYPSHNGSSETS